ncbi:MAG: C-GCAxxG-C-C family (seleno)protein [Candidatus Kariarchaeaceae archaeon]|jgi:hypothetical protein
MNDVIELVKETKKVLAKTQNCCLCHIVPVQSHYNRTETDLRKAVTGLAGGLNNNGSTCGAIFGGSINFALIQEATNNQEISDVDLLRGVNDYVTLFKETFGSTLCKDITALNLRSRIGQLQLLLPWKKNKCLKQAEFGIKHIMGNTILNSETIDISVDHCSTKVWEEIKKKNGYEDHYLERMSRVFTGGIGLSGDVCGAISTLIMYLGIKYRKLDIGSNPSGSSKSSYARLRNASNVVIESFIDEFDGVECRTITNEQFIDIDEFHKFRSNVGCERVYDFLFNFIE